MLPLARPRHHAANAVHPPVSQHGVFVYSAAVTPVLSTAGESIIASKRIRLSWSNAG